MSENKRFCHDCVYYNKCKKLISSLNETSLECDWEPTRFQWDYKKQRDNLIDGITKYLKNREFDLAELVNDILTKEIRYKNG